MNWKKIIKDKWPYIYFLVLTIVVFSGFIFSAKMLFGSDTVEAGVFFRSFYADFVKTYHRIPLWDPYIYGGLPFVDAMHGDTFYPLAAIQFIMPVFKALGYKLVVTVFLAGVFMYLYLRKMKMSKWAAVFGGTTYMLSGFLVSLVYAGQDGRMYVTSLLPLLLYTMEIGFERRKIFGWWPFALAFGLLILANHPQFAYFAMWCVGAYFVLKLIFEYQDSRALRPLYTPIVGFILALVFGLALGFVQIWPTQDYVRHYSPRSEEGKGYEYAASWALHAEEAFSQVIPGFSGYSNLNQGPETDITSETTYWGKNYFKINSEYAGLVAIILGIFGLFIYRDRYSWFFLGTALFALLYALGSSGLVFSIIYYTVPFVKQFRAPSTIMFLFCFAFAFLASRTVDLLEKTKKNPNSKKIFQGLLIVAGVYLLCALLMAAAGPGLMKIYTSIFFPKIEPGQQDFLHANIPNIILGFFIGALLTGAIAVTFWASLRKKMTFGTMAAVFITLVLLDSWLLNDVKFIKPVDPSPYFSKPPVVSFLESQPKPFRVLTMPGTLPNQDKLAQFGIDEVVGYHGNQLRWYNTFLGGSQMTNVGNPAVLALTNTQYILSRQQFNVPILTLAKSTSDGINIYQLTQTLPRARIVRNYQVVPDADAALKAVLDPGFDVAKKIIIDRAPSNQIIPQADSSNDQVEVLNSPADRIKVRANLSAPGLLAVQDNWYPYWKAFEGKSELPIFRSDYTFMALELSAGSHEIEFSLHNPKYILGKNVTIISWIVLFGGLGIGIIMGARKKTQSTQEQ